MKLTKSSLKEMIREVINEEKQLNEDIGTNWTGGDIAKNPMDLEPTEFRAPDSYEDKLLHYYITILRYYSITILLYY